MKHLLLALSALALLATFIPQPAEARCPPGSKYQCYPSANGKMQCGCF